METSPTRVSRLATELAVLDAAVLTVPTRVSRLATELCVFEAAVLTAVTLVETSPTRVSRLVTALTAALLTTVRSIRSCSLAYPGSPPSSACSKRPC
ncbi:MAG: hypothetical protein IPK34_04100 [Ramlibacter sp.]|nr:hypothetical protein [Ramlibacter sp.]